MESHAFLLFNQPKGHFGFFSFLFFQPFVVCNCKKDIKLWYRCNVRAVIWKVSIFRLWSQTKSSLSNVPVDKKKCIIMIVTSIFFVFCKLIDGNEPLEREYYCFWSPIKTWRGMNWSMDWKKWHAIKIQWWQPIYCHVLLCESVTRKVSLLFNLFFTCLYA